MDAWEKRKTEFLERIRADREIGYLDPGIEDTLSLINSRKRSYTTSSCIGRITAVDSDYPWRREDEEPVLFKKHGEITVEELKKLIEFEPKKLLWLIVSGPIIHICSRDLEEAKKLLIAARASGFKHSGIMSASEGCFMVELISGTQLFVPLRDSAKIFINEASLSDLLSIINGSILEGRERLKRLNEKLRELLLEEKQESI